MPALEHRLLSIMRTAFPTLIPYSNSFKIKYYARLTACVLLTLPMQETGVVVLVRDVRDSRGVALSWRGTVLVWWCGKCLTAYLAWRGGGVLSLAWVGLS